MGNTTANIVNVAKTTFWQSDVSNHRKAFIMNQDFYLMLLEFQKNENRLQIFSFNI